MPPFTIYYTLKLLKCQVLLSYYFIFFCVPYIVSTNCHIKEKTHLLTTTAGFRCVYVFYSLSVVCSHKDKSSSNCSGVRANTLSIMLCFLSFIVCRSFLYWLSLLVLPLCLAFCQRSRLFQIPKLNPVLFQ